jgi:hypothetical protein
MYRFDVVLWSMVNFPLWEFIFVLCVLMIAAVEKRYDKVSKLRKTVGCGFEGY